MTKEQQWLFKQNTFLLFTLPLYLCGKGMKDENFPVLMAAIHEVKTENKEVEGKYICYA